MTAAALAAAFFIGLGAGGDGGALAESEGQIDELSAEKVALTTDLEELEASRDDLDQQLVAALADLDDAPDVSDLEAQVAELEEQLSAAEARARSAEQLDERSDELDARAAALDEREATLERAASSSSASSGAASSAGATSSSGCTSGQVDINSAGSSELQRIHQIGPARADQFPGLRPFSSVDDLIRVSGIGPSHLAAIKGQGLACVS